MYQELKYSQYLPIKLNLKSIFNLIKIWIRNSLHFHRIIFFICGLAAGAAALALSLIFKVSINGLFVPEIASHALVSLTSGEIESRAVETLGPLAKYSTFFGATVVNLIVYGIIGIFIGFLYE